MSQPTQMSEKSIYVLSLIADGHSYAQIVDSRPDITYLDIFRAAEEALELTASHVDYQERMAKIKAQHPMAYAPWTGAEDAELASMHSKHAPVAEMARRFQRQPSAIRSRLAKLDLRRDGAEPEEN